MDGTPVVLADVPPEAPTKPTLSDIRAAIAHNKAHYALRASQEKTIEEDSHRFAHSVLSLCRLDDDELAAVKRFKEQRDGEAETGGGSHGGDDYHGGDQSVSSSSSTLEMRGGSGGPISDEERNRLFTTIQDLKKSMKKAYDPLAIALDIARLYVTLNLPKLSITYFILANKVVPYKAPRVYPQDADAEKKKLQRMSPAMVAAYLKDKKDAAEAEQARFVEAQRVRVMSSHYEIFLAHLAIKHAEDATRHMRDWLAMSRTKDERVENLKVLDGHISKYHDLKDLAVGDWRDKGYNSQVHVHSRHTLGTLRDLHLSVLEELLAVNEEDAGSPEDPVLLSKLARLHSFIRNFPRSQHLYERHVQATQGKHLHALREYKHDSFYVDKLVMPPTFPTYFGTGKGETTSSIGPLGAAPNRIAGWSVDAVRDVLHESLRRDFVGFESGDVSASKKPGSLQSDHSGGLHVGQTTILYVVPPGGWHDDDKPMRASPGGLVAAIGSSSHYIERDVKTARFESLQGYVMPHAWLRDTKAEQAPAGAYLDESGRVVVPVPRGTNKFSEQHDVGPMYYVKGGALPPRLYDNHDFRQLGVECHLSNPDVKVVRRKMSVFAADNQKFDLPPLVRFRKNGSALTNWERSRLSNIEAQEGKFGRTLEREMRSEPVQTFPGRTAPFPETLKKGVPRGPLAAQVEHQQERREKEMRRRNTVAVSGVLIPVKGGGGND